MFVHPRLKTVTVFTPPALPGFIAIPTAIPNQTSFCRPPSYCCLAYSALFQSFSQESSGRLACPTSPCAARCCLRPRSGRQALVFSALASVACVLSKRLGPPFFSHNGAYYQIQRLTLHLAASAQLRVSPASLARRVSALTLSIVSRVPSCCLAAVTHFDEHTGWLTTPFLRGLPPP